MLWSSISSRNLNAWKSIIYSVQSVQNFAQSFAQNCLYSIQNFQYSLSIQSTQNRHYHSHSPKTLIDAHDICIKAKAIAGSSGALAALPFALGRLHHPAILAKAGSQCVLLNTLLSALSRESLQSEFWDVVEGRLGALKRWSPELTATVLNQFALEGAPFSKALAFYQRALERGGVGIEPRNALLKCLSRDASSAELVRLLDEFSGGGVSEHLNRERRERDERSKKLEAGKSEKLEAGKVEGEKKFISTSSNSSSSTATSTSKSTSLSLDCRSVASALYTVARSRDGSICLAEGLWSYFQSQSQLTLDEECHLALLLVYRNDLARIAAFKSASWRKRKLNRVTQIITESGVSLAEDVKFLSVYFEICLNARGKERIREFCVERGWTGHEDERINACIKRAQIKK